MERGIAEELIALVLALDGPVGKAMEVANRIAEEGERRAIRRALGELTLHSYADLIRPIVRQFPDLDPEKSRGNVV